MTAMSGLEALVWPHWNAGMGYLAKAIAIDCDKTVWLTTPKLKGMRAFGSRDLAEVFGTREEAKIAILTMIDLEDCRGIQFSIDATSD
jgi:hypothetical protein